MMLEPSPLDVRPEQAEDLEYKIPETAEGEGASGEVLVQAAEDEPLQEATIEIGPLMPEKVLVNGIELAADSALRALKSVYAFYELSTSGGKDKCYRRLVRCSERSSWSGHMLKI